jgi:hypothetical protein
MTDRDHSNDTTKRVLGDYHTRWSEQNTILGSVEAYSSYADAENDYYRQLDLWYESIDDVDNADMLWLCDEYVETFANEAERHLEARELALREIVLTSIASAARLTLVPNKLPEWSSKDSVIAFAEALQIPANHPTYVHLLKVDRELPEQVKATISKTLVDNASTIAHPPSDWNNLLLFEDIHSRLIDVLRPFSALTEKGIWKALNSLPVSLAALIELQAVRRQLARTQEPSPERKALGDRLRIILQRRGLSPVDYLRQWQDTELREKWYDEAMALPDQTEDAVLSENVEPAREINAPAFLKLHTDKWALLMEAIGLELSRESGKYRWPSKTMTWYTAYYLLKRLSTMRSPQVFTHEWPGYETAFRGLFEIEGSEPKNLEHALTRVGKEDTAPKERARSRIDNALTSLTQRKPLIRRPK